MHATAEFINADSRSVSVLRGNQNKQIANPTVCESHCFVDGKRVRVIAPWTNYFSTVSTFDGRVYAGLDRDPTVGSCERDRPAGSG